MSIKLIKTFQDIVKKYPNKIAIKEDSGKYITYGALDQQSNAIASKLLKESIHPNDVVAIALPRSIQLVCAMLAVLKINATYLPIDIKYPNNRIKYIVSNSNAQAIISNAENSYGCKKIVDVNKLDFTNKNNILINNSSITGKYIYMIYTSGSTGNPKGVKIKEPAFNNLLDWYCTVLNLNSHQTVTLLASIGFDLAQKNVFAPLLCGGTLTLPKSGLIEYEQIAEHICKFKSNIISWTPSAFLPLIQNKKNVEKLSSLNYVVLGGESLRINKMRSWLNSTLCNCKIINIYGPTECTDVTSYYEVPKNKINILDTIPIGFPIPNVEMKLFDKSLQEITQSDSVGELYISGKGVAKEYFNNPDLSKERFILKDKKTYFKTGDLVKRNKSGEYIYVARNDNQVKIRGNRVELEEIENKLQELGFNNIIVTSYLTTLNTRNLIAFYTDERLDIDVLIEALKKTLPDYMIPTLFKYISNFPLNSNGKIDRKLLTSWAPKFISSQHYNKKKTDSFKEKVRAILSNCLQLEIKNNMNFFKVGGDSLKALIFIATLKQQLKIQVSISDLFENPIFDDFVKIIKSKNHLNENNTKLSLSGVFKTTPRISSSYKLTKKFNNLTDRNLFFILKSEEKIDTNRVQMAIKYLRKKHDALRVHFTESQNTLMFADNDEEQEKYEFLDYSKYSFKDINTSPVLKLTKYKFKPFENSFFKVYQIRYNNYDILLLLTHHLVADGQSMTILKNEFIKLLTTDQIRMTNVGHSFEKYCNFINSTFYTTEKSSEEKFWEEKLCHAAKYVFNPPADFNSQTTNFNATRTRLTLKSNTMQRILSVCDVLNITLPMFFMGIANLVIAKWINHPQFLIQLQVNGRSSLDEQKAVGYLANSVYMISNTDYKKEIFKYFEKIKTDFIEMLGNQNFPDEKAQKIIGNTVYSPFFYNFIFNNDDEKQSKIVELKDESYDGEFSNFDLIFETKINNKYTTIDLIYHPTQFSINTLLNLNKEIQQNIDSIFEKIIGG